MRLGVDLNRLAKSCNLSTNKERLDEEVLAYEAAIDKNTEEHNQLSDKVNALKLEINKTKRNTISLFANGLKVVKNLAMGKHEEVRKIITEMGNSVDAHEKATSEHEKARAILDDNEDERVVLDDEYANTVDERKECVDKIFRLKRQQAEAEKQIGMLREEAANESWSEMWKDAQEGIKSEMDTNNMPAFRRELSKQQEELDENLEADLGELDMYRNPSRIQRMMRTEEELQRDEKRVKEIEETLKEEYTNATAVIKSKQEKVDRYFPTWQERVDLIGRNRLVRGALHTLKRKIMMRVFGIN